MNWAQVRVCTTGYFTAVQEYTHLLKWVTATQHAEGVTGPPPPSNPRLKRLPGFPTHRSTEPSLIKTPSTAAELDRATRPELFMCLPRSFKHVVGICDMSGAETPQVNDPAQPREGGLLEERKVADRQAQCRVMDVQRTKGTKHRVQKGAASRPTEGHAFSSPGVSLCLLCSLLR